MTSWPATGQWVAPGFSGRFLDSIRLACPYWAGQKVVGAFLSLQALNPHTVVNPNGHVFELVARVCLPLIRYAVFHIVFETLVVLIA